MRRLIIPLLLCSFIALPAIAETPLAATTLADDIDGRIYGRITTDDGEVFEGIIRWDRNEASWVDVLNGDKVFYRDRRMSDSDDRDNRGKRIEIFGVTVYEENRSSSNKGGSSTRTSGIRFGHISTLERDGNSAILELQSGEKIEFKNGSTDIGSDIREIIVEDAERGEVELKWKDIDFIEFFQAPRSVRSDYGKRLHGTLMTRGGLEFTGFICWDIDEVLTSDILDGNDEKRRRRKVRFGNIDTIQRNSSSSSLVILKNGEEMVLRGTNDVNDDNSGILVLDPMLGQVEVDWSDFDQVTFSEAEYVPTFDDFGYSGPLYGTVFTRDGDAIEGIIRWDDDEASGWEFLDGEMDDLTFDIEFGKIRTIERISSSSAEVILFDGRNFDLRDSNDVDDDNDGIFIYDDNGDETRISWRDFDKIVFDKP